MAEGNEIPKFERLSKSNYPLWKFCLENYLQGKELGAQLTDDAPEGDDAVAFHTKDSKAKGIIAMTLDQEHLASVVHCATAKEMWTTIVDSKERASDTNKHLANLEWMEYRWKPGQTVSQYIAGLNLISVKLKGLGKEKDESDFISKVVYDLPSDYDNFRDNWRLVSAENAELLTKEKFVPHLLAAEQTLAKRKPARTGEALVSKNADFKKQRLCYECGQPGHLKKDCFKNKSSSSKSQGNKHQRPQKSQKGNKPGDTRKPKGFLAAPEDSSDSESEEGEVRWIADGGASLHLTSNRSLFSDYKTLDQKVAVRQADGTRLDAVGAGTVNVRAFDGTSWYKTKLTNVHHVPQLGNYNLFSLGVCMDKHGYHVRKSADEIRVLDGREVVLTGERSNGNLWVLHLETLVPAATACVAEAKNMDLWHARLGHTGREKLLLMKRNESANGFLLESGSEKQSLECRGCCAGRMIKQTHPDIPRRKCMPGERFSADLAGPMATESLGGNKYFLVVKDESSCFRQVYFLKSKAEEEVVHWIRVHLARAETETGKRIKSLRTDNGKEFCNQGMTELLESKGIEHETTVPYSPQQNGSVERDNRTIVEMANTMMQAASLPKYLWAELVNTAVYLMNRVPNRKEKVTPFELWYGSRPYVGHTRVIGSEVHVLIPKSKRNKFSPVSWQGLLVGYGRSNKFYRVYDPRSKVIKTVKDCKIFEAQASKSAPVSLHSSDEDEQPVTQEETESDESQEPESEESEEEKPDPVIMQPQPEPPVQQQERQRRKKNPSPPHPMLTRSKARQQAQQHASTAAAEQAAGSEEQRDSGGSDDDAENECRKQKPHALAYWYSLLSFHEDDVPTSYSQAVASKESEKWKEAMKDELQSLSQNKTWKLVPLPADRKAIANRWVFALKKEKGRIVRYKARLVAKGYSQRVGVDYAETFAPVVRYDSIRVILSVAAARQMVICTFDVKTAFLHGTIKETIFMQQPEGYDDGSGRVCLLLKGIYGLKQSPRAWNQTVHLALVNMGLRQLQSDPCVYVSGDHSVYLALFVDDGLLACETTEQQANVIKELRKKYELTVTSGSELTYIGLEIRVMKDHSLVIGQETYVKEILSRFGMQDSRSTCTPADSNNKLSSDQSPTTEREKQQMQSTPYKQAVGALIFLASVSRPDISAAVQKVARFFANPGQQHWVAVKRIMRYLSGTQDASIHYEAKKEVKLTAFADSDFAGDSEKSQSTSGIVLLVNQKPVMWMSRLQSTIALSTAEAEHNAITEAAKEIVWSNKSAAKRAESTSGRADSSSQRQPKRRQHRDGRQDVHQAHQVLPDEDTLREAAGGKQGDDGVTHTYGQDACRPAHQATHCSSSREMRATDGSQDQEAGTQQQAGDDAALPDGAVRRINRSRDAQPASANRLAQEQGTPGQRCPACDRDSKGPGSVFCVQQPEPNPRYGDSADEGVVYGNAHQVHQSAPRDG